MSTGELTDQRILLTGGAGFIGSHLAERLLAEGNDVLIVDDLSNGRREWVPDGAELVEDDLTEPSTVGDVIDDELEYVFHLAARKAVNDDRPRNSSRRILR